MLKSDLSVVKFLSIHISIRLTMKPASRDEILNIVSVRVRGRLNELGDTDTSVGDGTWLLGSEGVLDSLGLATVLLDIEDELRGKFQKTIVLASEQALSRKSSPFRTVATLTDYIVEI